MKINKFNKVVSIIMFSSIFLTNFTIQGKENSLYLKTNENVTTIKTTDDFKAIIEQNIKEFNDETFSIKFKYPYYFYSEEEMKSFIEKKLKYPLDKNSSFGYYNIQKYQYQYKYVISNNQYALREVLVNINYYNSKEDMMILDKKIKENILPEVNKLNNEYDKIKYIVKYIGNNLEYNQLTLNNDTIENQVLERNILNGLQKKGAVCVTYALLLDRILYLNGYESFLVEGKVEDRLHLWNMIKLDNVWYHIDSLSSDISIESLSKKIKELNPNISNISFQRTLWKSYSINFHKTFLVSDYSLSAQNYTWNKEFSPIASIDYLPK